MGRVKDDAGTTLAELKEEIQRLCEARDWDRFHDAKELAIGIATEAGELLQRFRFLSQGEVEAAMADPDSRAAVEAELADVLIFALRLAQRYEIDLATAVRGKLAANERRHPVAETRGSNRKRP